MEKGLGMKQIQINNTDLLVSDICLGSGNFGDGLTEADAIRVLDSFFDRGGNFLDTAQVYCRWVNGLENSSEQIIGKWLKERKLQTKVVVATKGGHYDLSNPTINRVKEDTIKWDLDESRRTLGLDRIDFYWLHRDNEEIPIEEIVDWMEELVSEQKIRYYGASNFSLKRLLQANVYAKEKGYQGFSAVSNEWSLAIRNDGSYLNDDHTLNKVSYDEFMWHKKTGMPLIPYSATAGGFFDKLYNQGKMFWKPGEKKDLSSYMNSRNLFIYNDMLKLHRELGLSFIQMNMEYLKSQEFQVIPVCGVSKVEQLDDLCDSAKVNVPLNVLEKWKSLPW